MTENLPKLSPRLNAAASLIRSGTFVADVGTDHAYLPIALCLSGIARGGVVSDINKGPIERARKNINKYGLSDKLFAVQADGLCGIDKYAPEDIMILGMGGELITYIIDNAPWLKNSAVQLCLQPMTHPEKLRKYLSENGYEITDELIAKEESKLYQIISAKYTGITYEYTTEQLLLGKLNVERNAELLPKLAEHCISVYEKRARGIEAGGGNAQNERGIINGLKKYSK